MIEAAIELLSAHGTHNTTLKEVGERAGYSRGLASERFGSKEGLFNAVLDAFGERWNAASAAEIGDQSGLSALRADVRAVRDFTMANPDDVRAAFIITYETIASSELIRTRLSRQHGEYLAQVAGWVREETRRLPETRIDPDAVAVQYLAGLFGITYLWLVDSARLDIGTRLDEFSEMFIGHLESSICP
jgi:AcrR family transcriptional regulator